MQKISPILRKIKKVPSGFPEFLSIHQEPVYSSNFFFKIKPILTSLDQSSHTHY